MQKSVTNIEKAVKISKNERKKYEKLIVVRTKKCFARLILPVPRHFVKKMASLMIGERP